MKYADENYMNMVKKAWQKYVERKMPFDDDFPNVPDETLASWKRSLDSGISPISIEDTQISAEELKRLQDENKALIDVAYPYLENLYGYVKGTNYLIQLCDKNGYILKSLPSGDSMHDLLTDLSRQREGYVVSEEKIGTNSSGLCLYLKKPVEIVGEEHFQKRNHNYFCSSAPIFDENNELLGVLTMMCPKDFYQSNTLGMVCTAVDGIQKELEIKKAYDELSTAYTMLSSTIESLTSGIILLDANKNVIVYNQTVLRLLRLPPESIVGKNFYSLVQQNTIPQGIRNLSKDIKETEITLKNVFGKKTDVILQISTILDNNDRLKASVLTIETQRHIYNLTNKLVGSHATYTFDSILGRSDAIRHAKNLGASAAESNSTVLILGESGTGKELLAQAIHNASYRADGPFISINCGAIPKNLIANELLGSEYGAFTGASKSGHPGKFELADGGTLFLDEIGDMPFDLQVVLLRVLQDREVTRLGGKFSKKIDVRVISATNKDLTDSMRNNTFRADLYYRLNVFNITIPPLRQRKEDIPLLTQFFISQYSNSLGKNVPFISDEAMSNLYAYSWPGNVRELENVIERAINISKTDTITMYDLPDEIAQCHLSANGYSTKKIFEQSQPESPHYNDRDYESSANSISPEIQEYEHLTALLIQEKGHVKSVAQQANMPLSTLYSKLNKYNLNPKDFKKW